MPPATPPPEVHRATDGPVYWFVKLECAIQDGDFAAAAEAQRELKRLGVIVRYLRPALPPTGPKLYEVPHAP
jgi:hypothetical protein